MNARNNAETFLEGACKEFSAASARCDAVLFLKALGNPVDTYFPFVNKIGMAISDFRAKLNEKSQGKLGNKSLRVDT